MRLALFLIAAAWPTPALAAAALATGSAPDIPWARLGIAILAGLLLAGGAAWLLRKRTDQMQDGRSVAQFFAKLSPGANTTPRRRIRIIETRRASQFADLCLIEADGRAYLLALTSGGATLIDCPAGPATETAGGPGR